MIGAGLFAAAIALWKPSEIADRAGCRRRLCA
jgi:hypothetical protein